MINPLRALILNLKAGLLITHMPDKDQIICQVVQAMHGKKLSFMKLQIHETCFLSA